MNKFAIALLVLVFFTIDGRSQTKTCSAADTKALDTMFPGAFDSWDKIYKNFKLYAQCDDGLYAEIFSEATVSLLAADANHIDKLNALATKDKRFSKFIMLHIDATADQDDLLKIVDPKKFKCSVKAKKLCLQIRAEATAALAELESLNQ
jgi:hypothetical protein